MGGVVVREYCQEPSNFRCDATVDTFLKEQNVVGIAGVDTRMLTQMIRDGGVMNAIITTEETKPDLEVLKTYRVEQSVENTSTKEAYDIPAQGEEKFSVALLDYGAKGSIPNSLTARGCKVTIYPYNTPAEEILAAGHDGVMLSNGPGDPADNTFCIEQIQKLFGKMPMFGICLGHQMMALAAGAKTKKLKFGHRGANQPAMRPDRLAPWSSPARTTAMPWTSPPWPGPKASYATSTSTTAPARAWITPPTMPSRSSSTPKPTAARWTARLLLTALLI